METVRLKLNYNLRGHKKGSVIRVKSRDGNILDSYWRRRFEDSKHDHCVELISPEKSDSKKSVKKVKDSKSDV